MKRDYWNIMWSRCAIKVQGQVYQMSIRLTLLYTSECCLLERIIIKRWSIRNANASVDEWERKTEDNLVNMSGKNMKDLDLQIELEKNQNEQRRKIHTDNHWNWLLVHEANPNHLGLKLWHHCCSWGQKWWVKLIWNK